MSCIGTWKFSTQCGFFIHACMCKCTRVHSMENYPLMSIFHMCTCKCMHMQAYMWYYPEPKMTLPSSCVSCIYPSMLILLLQIMVILSLMLVRVFHIKSHAWYLNVVPPTGLVKMSVKLSLPSILCGSIILAATQLCFSQMYLQVCLLETQCHSCILDLHSSHLKSSISYNINVSASLPLNSVSFMYLQQYLLISCK